MDNNQMIPVNEEGLIYKIKSFFRNFKNKLFGDKSYDIDSLNNYENENSENNDYAAFEDDSQINSSILETPETIRDSVVTNIEIQREDIDSINSINNNNKDIERENLLNQFDGNIDMLKMLSIDRLKRLEQYYDDIIKQNEELIASLS